MITIISEKYNPTKTFYKGTEIFLFGLLSFLTAYYSQLPHKPIVALIILSFIRMIQNYLKNKDKK